MLINLACKVTTEEHEKIAGQAAKLGLTLSAYVRLTLGLKILKHGHAKGQGRSKDDMLALVAKRAAKAAKIKDSNLV